MTDCDRGRRTGGATGHSDSSEDSNRPEILGVRFSDSPRGELTGERLNLSRDKLDSEHPNSPRGELASEHFDSPQATPALASSSPDRRPPRSGRPGRSAGRGPGA